MAEIPESIAGTVDRLIAEGEGLIDADQYADALARFEAAWDLLPEPKDNCNSSVQILAAIADCHYYLENWEACQKTLQYALRCGAGVDNSFIRLRLGQSLFELGDLHEASNWMAPAFLMEGTRLFDNENPKYLAFIKTQLDPPPGGWPAGW